ncbi:hypothetical protein RJ639_028565 [Escallonia herrerae]|uniref:Uncharacterized protein n=1 Tax=Escallonia herrerae TaxID=1293975 RepID=A0AA88X8N8_9ASTE|nr:hypothetical protein RJ639_028565 [Escallonia herrerae]
MLKVQVISNENVKPSSPTPHNLRTYKLSFLDQLIPAPYAPLVLFYPNLDGAGPLQILERLVVLKQSLFYPLAGSRGSSKMTFLSNENVFECGGVAIGLRISHKILDGASLNTFLKGWGTTARGSEDVGNPDFTAPSLFPANDLCFRVSSMGMWGSLPKKGDWITR